MDKSIITVSENEINRLISLVTDALDSNASKVMYAHNLREFMGWYTTSGNRTLNKAVVNQYKVHLMGEGLSSSTINQRLSAIRKLAKEASDNGLMDFQIAQGIKNLEGVKSAGVRIGNWLTIEQANDLLNSHDLSTLKGLRNRAIVAVMLGSGLRRSEVASLTFDHIQQREGRWVIVDLIGKGNKIRSVPIPSWTKQAINEWADSAGITSGYLFRAINKGGNLAGDSLTSQAIQDVIKASSGVCGVKISAHDLRRTYAKLSRKGGGDLKQIQISLGHSTIATTERYLGETQDLANAPCDVIGLRLNP